MNYEALQSLSMSSLNDYLNMEKFSNTMIKCDDIKNDKSCENFSFQADTKTATLSSPKSGELSNEFTGGNIESQEATFEQLDDCLNSKNVKTYTCPLLNCGKEYSNRSRLEIHVRTHTGEKPFNCSMCDKTFNEKGNLKIHMRIHTGEKPYKCTFEGCTKEFKAYGHLSDHLKRHYNIKPFVCEVCNASFSRRNTLKTHYMTHTGERPHECPLEGCSKRFSEKGNMKTHLKTHNKKTDKSKAIIEIIQEPTIIQQLATEYTYLGFKKERQQPQDIYHPPTPKNRQSSNSLRIFLGENRNNTPRITPRPSSNFLLNFNDESAHHYATLNANNKLDEIIDINMSLLESTTNQAYPLIFDRDDYLFSWLNNH